MCIRDSGKTAIINNYSVPNGQNLTVGMTSVKIVYTENGVSKEVEQPITVTLKQPINIRVKENVKKVYIVGEKVDKTNMCVEIEYDDGSIEQVTNYEVDTETSLSRADKTRTITYKEGDITLEKEIDVPVIALSQLSRAPEQRIDHRPMLSDLRESGSIEQDADIVMFLYRDDYYNEDTEKKNIAEVIIAKHRSGATGTVELLWLANYTKFANIERYRE